MSLPSALHALVPYAAVHRPPKLAVDSSPSTIRYQPYPIDIGYATCLILVEFVIDGGLTREARTVGSRRRGKVLETAIFEIVLRELAETGYVNFSIERVAARAGTSIEVATSPEKAPC